MIGWFGALGGRSHLLRFQWVAAILYRIRYISNPKVPLKRCRFEIVPKATSACESVGGLPGLHRASDRPWLIPTSSGRLRFYHRSKTRDEFLRPVSWRSKNCHAANPWMPTDRSVPLFQLAYREAATLAYADAFRAIIVAFVFATLLAPFPRSVAAPSPSGGGGH